MKFLEGGNIFPMVTLQYRITIAREKPLRMSQIKLVFKLALC